MRTARAGDIAAHKAQAACLRARTGALRSAAEILFGNSPSPPNAANNEHDPQPVYHRAAHAPAEEALFREAITAADNIPEKHKLRPRLRDIAHQLARLKPSAGPRSSGWRNSHIACLYAARTGPQALI